MSCSYTFEYFFAFFVPFLRCYLTQRDIFRILRIDKKRGLFNLCLLPTSQNELTSSITSSEVIQNIIKENISIFFKLNANTVSEQVLTRTSRFVQICFCSESTFYRLKLLNKHLNIFFSKYCFYEWSMKNFI